MDLRSLRYFVSAVNEGSISGASLKCHVAQPSITLAISKLEDEFGCKLLHRHRKGVGMTEKGEAFFQMAVELLQHADSIETRFKDAGRPIRIKLAMHRSIQVSYVEKITTATRELSLPVEFIVSDSKSDADLTLGPRHQLGKQGVFYPIATERYSVLIPVRNSLAHQTSMRISDLDGQPLIERIACENRALFEQMIAHFELNLPVAATVDNEEWALALVAAGVGLSISPVPIGFKDPRFVVRGMYELLDMETPERQIGMCYQKSLSSDVQEVLDQIGRYFTEDRR